MDALNHWKRWIGAMSLVLGTWALPAAEPPPLPPLPPLPGPPRIRPASSPATVSKAVVSTPQLPPRPGQPVSIPAATEPLAWDGKQKTVQIQPGEVEGKFKFALTNVSLEDVTISHLQTSCGCTAAKLPSSPWTLKPGENGEISVTMNVQGKVGETTKSVTVHTDKGAVYLLVTSRIPDQQAQAGGVMDRSKNLQIATADRQAVFRGECATCHTTPTLNKHGKELFTTACGVCHDAEHRASFVPSLRALNKPTDTQYWRTWITYGREGSLMPAFAKTKGGILDPEQIESLVAYLQSGFTQEPAPDKVSK